MTAATRWEGAGALALVAVAAGVAVGRPALLVAATVPVAFAAVARVRSPPEPSVTVSRSVSDRRPDPGDEVRVTLRVRNDGDATLRSLRVADRVPRGVRVVDGSPERATPLRPGATATVEYAVAATRGRHEFDSLDAVTGAPPGGRERRTTLRTEPATVECVPRLAGERLPPRRALARLAGPAPSPDEGAGTEFSSVRDYRRGDPVSRIDFRGWAKRGEPATVSYRAERTARVVVVVDARAAAYVAPDPEGPPAVDRCVAAARAVAAGLLDAGHRVGVAALSPRPCRLPPGVGSGHRARVERTLGLDPAFGATPPGDGAGERGRERTDADGALTRLRRRLPGDARVVVCSPLVDDAAAEAVRRLDAHGHRVAVVTPDPTTGATADDDPPERFAGAERDRRLAALRGRGVPVADLPWGADPGRELRGWTP